MKKKKPRSFSLSAKTNKIFEDIKSKLIEQEGQDLSASFVLERIILEKGKEINKCQN